MIKYRGVLGVTNAMIRARFNNDSGSNYGYQYIYGGGSSIGAILSTNETGIRAQDQGTAGDIEQIEITAYVKGGYLRTAILPRVSRVSGTTVNYLNEEGWVWNNTADNITSLVFVSDLANGLGVGTNIELYKKSAKQ